MFVFRIPPPFLYQSPHIIGQFTFEEYLFSCSGVNEADGFGMQGVPGAYGEAIVHELSVFAEHSAFYDFVAAIGVVIKKRMADVLHMDTDLVCSSCLQNALYERDIAESFQYFIMGDRFFSVLPLGVGGE